MDKKQKVLVCFAVIFIIAAFMSLFVLSGCGRRLRAKIALQSKSEATETQTSNQSGQTENTDEEEVAENQEEIQNIDNDETGTQDDSSQESGSGEDSDDSDDSENDGSDEAQISSDDEDDTEEEQEFTVESSEDSMTARIAAVMPFVRGECGNIIGETAYTDPVIYPGDSGADNLEVRGFVSFDISEITGLKIVDAKISGDEDKVSGTPFQTYGPMIIRAVFWGTRAITPSDFNLDGTEITNVSAGNFGKSPDVLKDDLQRAADSGSGRYQLCFYFEMPQTDGDSESDNVSFFLEDISLNATYEK